EASNSFRICDDNLSEISPGGVSIVEYSDAMEYIEQYFDPGSVIRENILDNQSAVFVSITDTPSDFSNISIDRDYSLCLPDFDFPNQNVLMTNVTITGRALIPWDILCKQEGVLSNRDFDRYFLSGQHLIVQNLTAFLFSIPSEHRTASYGLLYYFDLKAFDSFDPDEILEEFDSLAVDAQRNLAESQQFDHFNVDDGISFQIEQVRHEINTIRIGLLLFSIPVLIVAIFLANYSFGLIQRVKFQQIGIYLTRGTSRSQLTVILVVETFLSLVISLIGGILLGLPLAALVVKTSGFLEFNKPKNPVIFWMDLIESVATFGVVLVTILNFVRIFRLGKLTISDAEVQAVEEKTEPFWKRKYLDIGLLAFGLFFYGLFILLMSEQIGVDPGIAFLLALLILPTPLLIIVGAIMVTARIFPFITGFISKLQWERQGGLFSFSLKNIVRHRQNSTRAILIASMNLAMIVLFLSFPSTMERNIKTQVYYDTGADIRVGLSDPSWYNNSTILDYILTNISSEIEEYSPGLIARLKNNQIMVINTTTFAKTAWMEDYFVSDLSSALKNLNKDNASILLYEKNLKAIKGKVGDSLLWPKRTWDSYENPYVGVPIHFTVRGTFRYWPNLLTDYYEVEEYPKTQFLAVANFDTYENVAQIMKNETANEEEYIEFWATGLRIEHSFLYLRIKNNANLRLIEETLETLVEETSVITYYSIVQEEYEARMRNPTTLSLFAQFNSNLIFCLGIAVLVLAMFGFLQLVERGREIATERALGLSVSQTVRLFLYDTLWLLGFSLLTGLLIGTFFASLFVLPLTLGQTFPPWSMIFPWDLIIGVMVLILIGSVGFSLIPAYLSSKIEVTRLLKVE
ncbi:MAG: FtsX-like permease family protein, partial [Candidatus Hodarchaeales archaeon]